MSILQKVFPEGHTVLIVIHADNEIQTQRNVSVASDAGAHGVFLINHGISTPELLRYYDKVRVSFPNLWIGVNCLGLSWHDTVKCVSPDVNGLWRDDAGIREDDSDPKKIAEEFQELRMKTGFHGIYFGGVAFKYQPPVKDAATAALLAAPYVDVVTTSGDATGRAASIEKVKLMRGALGDHPLALASGITPENVENYMPYVDCFLVATGVSYSQTELSPHRVKKLLRAVA
jgi:hypothetical protein